MKAQVFSLSLLLVASQVRADTGAGGRFIFENFSNSTNSPAFAAPVTIGPNGVPGQGAVGAYVGSDYTAAAFYLPGNFLDQTSFDSSSPVYIGASHTGFLG